MAVSPGDIHSVAEKLWDGSPISKSVEQCVRTVANRAYYSAYHAILGKLCATHTWLLTTMSNIGLLQSS